MAPLINAFHARMQTFWGHSIGCPRRAPVLHAKAAARQAHIASAAVELKKPVGSQHLASGAAETAASPSLTAELLAEKEDMLRDLLEPTPNSLPPKASVVSQLRKEIAELRQQLRSEILAAAPGTKLELPSSVPRHVKGNGRVSPARLRSILDQVATGSGNNGAMALGAPQGGTTRVREALRLVETRLASGDASGVESVLATVPSYTLENAAAVAAVPVGAADDYWMQSGSGVEVESRRRADEEVLPSSPEQLALEVLQIENARLRARMEVLLAREAQLKALAHKYLLDTDRSFSVLEAEKEALQLQLQEQA